MATGVKGTSASGSNAYSVMGISAVRPPANSGLKDPRVAPWTSVVAAEVAPDLKTCKAYISVLGNEEEQKNTMEGLRSAEGFIRRELARTLNMRNTPEITFVLDQSIEYGVTMSKKIEEVTRGMTTSEGEKDVEE